MSDGGQSRPGWVKCIADANSGEAGKSWCGRTVWMEWAFLDIDHAAISVKQSDRKVPCPECLAAVQSILWPNAPGSAEFPLQDAGGSGHDPGAGR